MNRTDRLTGILLALRGGRQTVAQLADRFEVSRRTILRDVAALSEVGVPLLTLPGTGGGVEIAEGYWLPPLHLSSAEAALLLLALQGLGGVANSPFGQERRTAEEKLRAALRPDVAQAADAELSNLAISPPLRAVQEAHFQALRREIARGGWVEATYQSSRRIATHQLRPLRLFLEGGRWYLNALLLGEGSQRRYRIDRFETIRPILPPAGTGVTASGSESAALPYNDPSHPEVVIHLTYAGMRRAEDEDGWVDHLAQLGSDHWELRYRCPPAELPFYARLVYALGPEAEALAPPGFRAMVRELAEAAAGRYRDD